MTIGRWNSVASETRSNVSWNVERGPNSGRNCFGRTSRDAGHSRVPAPPHMISGTMLRFSSRQSRPENNLTMRCASQHISTNMQINRCLFDL
jgi:hypothetical protein